MLILRLCLDYFLITIACNNFQSISVVFFYVKNNYQENVKKKLFNVSTKINLYLNIPTRLLQFKNVYIIQKRLIVVNNQNNEKFSDKPVKMFKIIVKNNHKLLARYLYTETAIIDH